VDHPGDRITILLYGCFPDRKKAMRILAALILCPVNIRNLPVERISDRDPDVAHMNAGKGLNTMRVQELSYSIDDIAWGAAGVGGEEFDLPAEKTSQRIHFCSSEYSAKLSGRTPDCIVPGKRNKQADTELLFSALLMIDAGLKPTCIEPPASGGVKLLQMR